MVSVVEAVVLELVFMLLPDSDDCQSLETVSNSVKVLEGEFERMGSMALEHV